MLKASLLLESALSYVEQNEDLRFKWDFYSDEKDGVFPILHVSAPNCEDPIWDIGLLINNEGKLEVITRGQGFAMSDEIASEAEEDPEALIKVWDHLFYNLVNPLDRIAIEKWAKDITKPRDLDE